VLCRRYFKEIGERREERGERREEMRAQRAQRMRCLLSGAASR
jgi:hypothetical protein